MSKKCAGCGRVFHDSMQYCTDCGGRLTQIAVREEKEKSGGFDFSRLIQLVFKDYILITVAILSLLWDGVQISLILSAAVLIAPFLDRSRTYRALPAAMLLAIGNIIWCLSCL